MRLTPRERLLLGVAAACLLASAIVVGGLATYDRLARLRARVAGHERELGEVRRLAALLGREGTSADQGTLLTRLEVAATASVGRERVASMVPASAGEERVTLRVADASLAEVVRFLHAIETGAPPLVVPRLALRKHPDDPARFDATLEVIRR